MYGLKILGDANNLILGDEQPVLVAVTGGRLYCNRPAPDFYWQIFNGSKPTSAHFGHCEVTYATPIESFEPPLVFAIPTPYARGGLGNFCHVQSGGKWTGFRIMYIPALGYSGGRRPAANEDTGWDFKACTFGSKPSGERYGMRVWNAEGRLTFDSSWAVVAFRNLLTGWTLLSRGKSGGSSPNDNHYWGNGNYNGNKDVDVAHEVYSHPWGAQDGEIGVMVSSLGALRCTADAGGRSPAEFLTAPMVGFLGTGRVTINASVTFGHIQHASTVYPAMNSFALMTADFKHT